MTERTARAPRARAPKRAASPPDPPPGPRAPRAARRSAAESEPPARTETQRRILDAALGLFAEKGFDGVTTAQIAARARVAEKTIFANFGSKERLYRATIEPERLLAVLMPEIVRTLAPVFEGAPDDLRALLQALINNRVKFARAHRREIKLFVHHLLLRPGGVKTLVGLWSEHMAPIIEPLVARLVAKGALRADVPPTAILRIVATSVIGYVLSSVVLRPDLPWDDDREIEQITALLIDGLAPRDAPAPPREKR